MSLAEQKEKFHKVIEEADGEMMAQLLELFQQMQLSAPAFSKEDMVEFSRRSDEHDKNPGSSIPWAASMAHIRNKLQK